VTWERYEPKCRARIVPGEASLTMDGSLTIRDVDLEQAGIAGNRVVVMMDTESRRVMLREPEHPGEPCMTLSRCRSSPPASKVNLSRVIEQMGVSFDQPVRCRVGARDEGGLVVMFPGGGAPQKAKATPIRKEAGHG